MKLFAYILLVLLNINACSKQSDVTEINFGGGGGFTGAITTFKLRADGNLSEIKNNQESNIKTISKKQMTEILDLVNKVKTSSFNEPDNIYSFIEICSAKEKNRIVWGLGSKGIDKNITELYNKLMLLTK